MAFQSLSPCRSRTRVPTVAPSPATGSLLALAVMGIILPDRAAGHAQTRRDDHHVVKRMTSVKCHH
ncbi:hypothetical protein GCM10027280_38620 [Micromonospora polyrhachis]